MKEIKILLIISFFVGILYYGVEPFAHHQMHPHTADADYEFSDLKDVRAGKVGNVASGKSLIVDQFQLNFLYF